MVAIPNRLSRPAALAILFLLLALPLQFGFAPLVRVYGETNEALAAKKALLERLESELAGREALEQRIKMLTHQHVAAGYYLDGASEAAAAAGLQERIGLVADENQAELRSMQALPAIDEGGLRRLTLRVVMTATVPELFQVLYALENDRPFAFVDNLELDVRRARDKQASSQDTGLLTVRFDFYGYLNPQNFGKET